MYDNNFIDQDVMWGGQRKTKYVILNEWALIKENKYK